jgi:hypothetical protein
MNRREIDRLKSTCAETSRIIKEVEGIVFPWATRKKYVKQMRTHMCRFEEQWERFESSRDEFEETTLSQALMARLLSEPKTIRSLLKQAKAHGALDDRTAALMQHWTEEPWYMTAFRVIDQEGEHILRIFDYDDESEYILCSEGIASLHAQGKNNFYTLLLSNGKCLQTYGMLCFLNWADHRDFAYFAARLDAQLYDRGGLTEVMTEHPVECAALFAYSGIPQMGHRGEEVEVCDSVVTCGEVDPRLLPADADTERSGNHLRIRLSPDDPMFGAQLLWRADTRKLYLYARTRSHYERGCTRAAPLADFPREPQEVRSGPMDMAAHLILGPDRFARAEEPFAREDEEQGGTQERLDRALEHIRDAHMRGEELDIDVVSAQTQIPPDELRRLQERMHQMLDEHEEQARSDFLGISTQTMHRVLYEPFSEGAGLYELRPERADERSMAEALWPAVAMELLKSFGNEGSLKATSKGNLPRQVVHALVETERRLANDSADPDLRLHVSGLENPRSEEDELHLHIVHVLLKLAGYIEHTGRSLTLSSTAREVLHSQDVRRLYTDLLITAAESYNLTYYTRVQELPIIQQAMGFLLYAAHLHTESGTPDAVTGPGKLAEVIRAAFPQVMNELEEQYVIFSKEEELELMLSILIFGRFALPFGLMRRAQSRDTDEKNQFIPAGEKLYHPTALFHALFKWL